MIGFLIIVLLALGLLLVSFLASVLRDIGEMKRHLSRVDEDLRELIRHVRIPPDPVKNAKTVDGVTRDVRK